MIPNQDFFMPLNIPLDLVAWNHMSMKINKTNVNKGIQSIFIAMSMCALSTKSSQ